MTERNRALWDDLADWYEDRHGSHLSGDAWGYWQIPESELNVLGEVAGTDVLELGCGAGRFSIAQLEHARLNGADFPLVHAAAEQVPLPDARATAPRRTTSAAARGFASCGRTASSSKTRLSPSRRPTP